MAEPKRYTGVVNYSYGITFVMYLLMAVCVMFGWTARLDTPCLVLPLCRRWVWHLESSNNIVLPFKVLPNHNSHIFDHRISPQPRSRKTLSTSPAMTLF
ncbi:hypothetical protein BC938DRAFT_474388 [Jimgerdemannia flammicorona]|uniref:Uncharacterized protein n=1 Tax=Jimgerdemannia flammicorona TaxID=994334 RepID=A0A433Q2E4_9FUNG|nr:hypothetical protein BC938DRAFT_474388 [Jimgerdemannia flammicorona]